MLLTFGAGLLLGGATHSSYAANAALCTAKGTTISHVSDNFAAVRRFPIVTSEMVGSIQTDAPVSVCGSRNGWYYIQYGDLVGWSSAKLIHLTEPITSSDQGAASAAPESLPSETSTSGRSVSASDRPVTLSSSEIERMLIGHTMMWRQYEPFEGQDLGVYVSESGYLMAQLPNGRTINSTYKIDSSTGRLCTGKLCVNFIKRSDYSYSIFATSIDNPRVIGYITNIVSGDRLGLVADFNENQAKSKRKAQQDEAMARLVGNLAIGMLNDSLSGSSSPEVNERERQWQNDRTRYLNQ